MTIQTPSMLSQVAELCASRDALASNQNAERLMRWQSRYPHDVVNVPVPSQPPKWPAARCSIPAENNVTRLSSKRRGE